jgi:hypothetical protein
MDYKLRNQPEERSEDFVLICATALEFVDLLDI